MKLISNPIKREEQIKERAKAKMMIKLIKIPKSQRIVIVLRSASLKQAGFSKMLVDLVLMESRR